MGLKKDSRPGVYLEVDGLNVLSDPDKTTNSTQLQILKGKTYFAARNLADIKQALSDMANDSRITPVEKVELQKQWDRINLDHSVIIYESGEWKLTGTQEYADYLTAYTALASYLSPMLATPEETSVIDPVIYKGKFDDYFSAYEALYTKKLTTAIKVEEYEGYDLTNDGVVVATTTPEVPVPYASSTLRDIYISWPRQKNLTGAEIHCEMQISDIPFTSVDLSNGYSIGPGGDGADDWKGSAGTVSKVYTNNIAIKNFPLSWNEGVPGAKTYFFRVRRRQSDIKVSAWAEFSAATYPIQTADVAHDSVSTQMLKAQAVTEDKVATGVLEALIASIQSYITVGTTGFTGANYDLSNISHLYTTSDRRAYIDKDEITFQEVVSVSVENVPTWSDVIKIGGTTANMIFSKMGQMIGYDIGGAAETAVGFGIPRSDFSSYPTGMPDYKALGLQSSGLTTIIDSDTNAVIGYINHAGKKLVWDGPVQFNGDVSIGGLSTGMYGNTQILFNSSNAMTVTGIYTDYGNFIAPVHSKLVISINGERQLADSTVIMSMDYKIGIGGTWTEVLTMYIRHVRDGVDGLVRQTFYVHGIIDLTSLAAETTIYLRYKTTGSLNPLTLVRNEVCAKGDKGDRGEKGETGDKGDTVIVGNIDGGHAGSIFGPDQIIDCGGAS